jgi:hypothetical protein
MPTDRYNASESEVRWQKVWDERGILFDRRSARFSLQWDCTL